MGAKESANLYLKNASRWTSPVFLLRFLYGCKLDGYEMNIDKVEAHDVVAMIIGLGVGGGMNLDDVVGYVKKDLEELRKTEIPALSEEFEW